MSDRRGMADIFRIGVRRWIEYLVAILLGNLIYYKSLTPYLPGWLQHREFRPDGGMAMDFLVCVVVYGLIRIGAKLSD